MADLNDTLRTVEDNRERFLSGTPDYCEDAPERPGLLHELTNANEQLLHTAMGSSRRHVGPTKTALSEIERLLAEITEQDVEQVQDLADMKAEQAREAYRTERHLLEQAIASVTAAKLFGGITDELVLRHLDDALQAAAELKGRLR